MPLTRRPARGPEPRGSMARGCAWRSFRWAILEVVMPRPLPLRAEQPPDDTTLVVRAGVMAVDGMRQAAQRSFELYAVLGISVEAVIGRTVRQACRSERVVGYRRVRLSTFGRLRAEGFAL